MNNYQHYSMDDIIFENRNKAYGAFQLRQISDKNALYGLLVTTSAIIVFTIIALFMPHTGSTPVPRTVEVIPSDILVEVLPPVLPKTITPPQSVAPPRSQIFTEIIPTVETPTTTTEPPKQIDLATSTAAISTTNENNNNNSATVNLSANNNIGTTTATATEIPVKPVIEKWAEIMPSFVGGNEALMKYLKSHISMDSRDVEMGIGGKVVVQFYIDIDGSIKDVKVIKDSAGGHCAERALSAINNMPKWNPGKQGDKAVRVYHTLPITFQVN